MQIHEENNQRQALKLEFLHQQKIRLEEQKMMNRQRKLQNEQIKTIHKQQILAAKKSEYIQSRQVKEQVLLEKHENEEDYLKKTHEQNHAIKEWKARAKSISHHADIAKQCDIKKRYDFDHREVLKK